MCISYNVPGVEKKNDDYRRYFHRKINRWDACTSLLLVEKRQEALHEHQRQPRKYLKRDEAFWFNGGKKEGAKKYPRISLPVISEDPVIVDAQLTPAPTSKRVLDRSEKELKKLKLTELVCLLTEIVGYQPNLPKKPRKPDVLSKILDVATPRGD